MDWGREKLLWKTYKEGNQKHIGVGDEVTKSRLIITEVQAIEKTLCKVDTPGTEEEKWFL